MPKAIYPKEMKWLWYGAEGPLPLVKPAYASLESERPALIKKSISHKVPKAFYGGVLLGPSAI